MSFFSRKPKSPIDDALLAKIEKFVRKRAVTDSVMALARALGPDGAEELKVLEAIDVIHAYAGRLPDDLRVQRALIRGALLSKAIRVTDPATYSRLDLALGAG